MAKTVTVRLEDDVKHRLDCLADATHQSKSHLASEAICELVANYEWQIQEIKTAIKEAKAGDFASDEDVVALALKWNVSGKANAR